MTTRAFAPAKINLFLHVGPLGADGYHPLESWMVFADVGDELVLNPGERGFQVEGPFADGVPSDSSNLAIRARDLTLEGAQADFGLTLVKNLPPASGIGGGSSDAAAVLHLIAPEDRRLALAARLGSDVPACVKASSLIARGRGEQLSGAPRIPSISAVLVNPGVAVSTAQVFRIYDASPIPLTPLAFPGRLPTFDALVDFLERTRNDLQCSAVSAAPVIAEVLEALSNRPQARLARLSGSGATCFALCDSPQAADDLASSLSAARPEWWVKACILA